MTFKGTIDRQAEKRLLARYTESAVREQLHQAADKGARAAAAISSRSPIGVRIGDGGTVILTDRTPGKRWVRQVMRVMLKASADAATAELERYDRG